MARERKARALGCAGHRSTDNLAVLCSAMRILLLLGVACCFLCAFTHPASGQPATAPSNNPEETPTAASLRWHREQGSQAYERIGRRNPQWDATAREMIEAWSVVGSSTRDEEDVMLLGGEKARTLGCDDPLVMYIAGRTIQKWLYTPEHVAAMFDRALQNLRKSEYHPAIKAITLARAAKAKAALNNDAARAAAKELLDEAVALVPAMAKDNASPTPGQFLMSLMNLIGEGSIAVSGDRATYAMKLLRAFDQNSPDKSMSMALSAAFFVRYGWDARGSGAGSTVSEEAANTMHERMKIAEEACAAGWKADPKNLQPPLLMLQVELAQGEGRERMELWFARATKADPDSLEPYTAKMYYLEPKWRGSPEEMLEFGRECAASENWEAGIPLILVDAHMTLSDYAGDRLKYFDRNKQAWKDIRGVYDRYLARHPDSKYHRSRYSQIAYFVGDVDVAVEQFRALKNRVSLNYFRSEDDYRQYRTDLQQELMRERPHSDGL
jgi:hypothetical protein